MKQLKITVNGKIYDVSVEEVGGFSSAPATVAAPVAAAPAPVAAPAAPAAPVAESAPAAPAPAAVGSGEGEAVVCPMPGNIVDVKVSVGQNVKSGDVLMILEAMKMENEIVSPKDGAITSVGVSKGESVDSGKVLLTIQ